MPGGRPICIDTGATICISNNKADLIDFTPVSNTVVKGISSGLSIEGCGTICWEKKDDLGNEINLLIHNSLYVPQAPMCLLSPQSVAQQTNNKNDGFHVHYQHGIFTFASFKKTIFYNSTSNLPIFFTSTDLNAPPPPPYDISLTTAALLSSTALDDNLSPLQRPLLRKRFQFQHLHMTRIQDLAKLGIFGDNKTKLASCGLPLCKACLHGKQHKCPISSDLCPGDCISTNQLESSHPGLVPTYKGSPSTSSFHTGTLFIDHASHFLHFTPHLSTGAMEAINAKNSFELLASTYNCFPKRY
jgi:hypothetical protein